MKTIVITGASSGIGRELAIEMADKGMHLILTGRNKGRLEAVRNQICMDHENCEADAFELDLNNIESIDQFSQDLHSRFKSIDLLVNNAGSFNAKRVISSLGFEMTMGVNCVGTLLLTDRLLDLLESSPSSSIINISSDAYKFGKINYDDFDSTQKFHSFKAYAASKRALALMTLYLGNQFERRGIIVNSVHPGHVATNIWSYAGKGGWMDRMVAKISAAFAIPVEKGVETALFVASADPKELGSGNYFSKCQSVDWKKEILDRDTQKYLSQYLSHRLEMSGISLKWFNF